MGFADAYLGKQNFRPAITSIPSGDLECIIVLPSYRDECLSEAVESLLNLNPFRGSAEIIVVLNAPSDAPSSVIYSTNLLAAGLKTYSAPFKEKGIGFHIICRTDLPRREAGVGLARKIGMDEALYRFNMLDRNNGIIASFDADGKCEPNFLKALYDHFLSRPETPGCSVYFEHELNEAGSTPDIHKAIVRYELYLRYYVQSLRYAGFPYAFHTLGSSFAVKADIYARQGGMNKRKAGEDFYFLHKIIPLGHFTDLNDTCIYLSSRPSDRVPFGTGAAVRKILCSGIPEWPTYTFTAFKELKPFFGNVSGLYKVSQAETEKIMKDWPEPLVQFLRLNNFAEVLDECKKNSAHPATFIKRFYAWFNGFRVLKYLNFSHTEFYHREDVSVGARELLDLKGYPRQEIQGSPLQLLHIYREMDRKDKFGII